ncbi:oxidoreductase [Lithospermum erythrorhizon]|uniref:Oxidoreductase n=1 Tax=Lithospermum erythrorhizon TaxID=34254 RepID=A0AAV3S1B4_LITER
MALLLDNNINASRWFDVDAVPEDYKFPHEFRPGNFETENNKQNSFPVINLSNLDHSSEEKEETIKKILKSCQEFGGFQVINHGFSEEVIKETISVLKEFFSQPVEEKVYKGKENGWLYLSSTDYANDDGVHLWRENIKLSSHPLEDCMQRWPEKPSKYREVMATYLLGIRRLSSRILELICEGLGLGADYLKDVNEVQLLSANNYPPCPNPSLTLGLLKHRDPSFITLLYQGNISGLQMMKDGEWFTVEALSNAFVVNIGNQLEVCSKINNNP